VVQETKINIFSAFCLYVQYDDGCNEIDFILIFRFDEKSIARPKKSKLMKYTYKLNSRRSLVLKKRDVYGITSNDLVVIKTLSNCLLL